MSFKTINETFWTDPDIAELKPNEKLLFIYLITNPHSHFTGIYHLPEVFMVHETGLNSDAIFKGRSTLEQRLLIMYDLKKSVVWVRNMMKYQRFGKMSENQKISVINQLSTLHNSLLINNFLDKYPNLELEDIKGWSTFEQELVKGSYTDIGTDIGTGIDKDSESLKTFCNDIISYLNEKTKGEYKVVTSNTKLIGARRKEGFTLDDFKKVIDNQTERWLNDPENNKYLRPETLFRASKFQGYLNAPPIKGMSKSNTAIADWLKDKKAEEAVNGSQ